MTEFKKMEIPGDPITVDSMVGVLQMMREESEQVGKWAKNCRADEVYWAIRRKIEDE